ncbi:MAG: FAD binding domain-containing protein [Firmicutes bacterium]|nr:FAD binding domain-containing protein [Bacillota bacterium]
MVKQVIAKTLIEALNYLNEEPYQVLAGGTDLMIQNRSSADTPVAFKKNILYVSSIEELKYIKKKKNQILIGALTPLETIMNHELTPAILKETISEMASPAIRHIATLSGNIGNASPAGDSLVPLYLLDCKVKLASKDKERLIFLKDLIVGPRITLLEENEMITEIQISCLDFTKSSFVKVGGRKADAISKVSFAGAVLIKEKMIVDLRFVFGSVYKTVVRLPEIEQKYKDWTISELKDALEDVLQDYEKYILPIDDQRSTSVYRKKVALNLLSDFIENL